MRPIDSDVLLKKFSAECEYSEDCKKTEPCITCIINGCPTLDVELIKHGHWRVAKSSEGLPTNLFVCSECMGLVQISVYCYHCIFNYCPNCGARMDGEAK